MKLCTKCGLEKEITEFYKDKNTKDGLCWWCKSCRSEHNKDYRESNKELIKENKKLYYDKNKKDIQRKARKDYLKNRGTYLAKQKEKYKQNPNKDKSKKLLKTFGINLNQYNDILEKQNGVCAICGKEETSKQRSGLIRYLNVDHSHKSNKIRGLLCTKCNLGIGCFNDDTEILQSAINYLKVTQND